MIEYGICLLHITFTVLGLILLLTFKAFQIEHTLVFLSFPGFLLMFKLDLPFDSKYNVRVSLFDYLTFVDAPFLESRTYYL